MNEGVGSQAFFPSEFHHPRQPSMLWRFRLRAHAHTLLLLVDCDAFSLVWLLLVEAWAQVFFFCTTESFNIFWHCQWQLRVCCMSCGEPCLARPDHFFCVLTCMHAVDPLLWRIEISCATILGAQAGARSRYACGTFFGFGIEHIKLGEKAVEQIALFSRLSKVLVSSFVDMLDTPEALLFQAVNGMLMVVHRSLHPGAQIEWCKSVLAG